MIKARINGRPIEIETSWDELDFSKFLKLMDAKDDYFKIISVMTDLPEDDLRKAKFEGLEHIIKALRFLQVPPLLNEHPERLGEYVFPKDITIESIEQFETLKKYIKKAAESEDLKTQTEYLALYTAIYCQAINEPFDEEKAIYMSQTLKTYPCLEVMSAGSFFMAKVLSSISGLPMSYLRKNTPMKKSRPDLKGFRKRLASTRFWILLRVMWDKMTNKS